MMDGDGMFARNLVEIVDIEPTPILDLGVVVEESFHPEAGRHGARFGAQLLDDGIDGDELDLVRVSDEDFIKQRRARRVVMRVDEARNGGHAFRVVDLRSRTGERADVIAVADGRESPGLDREGWR